MNARLWKCGEAGLLFASLLLGGCGGSSEQASENVPSEAAAPSVEAEAPVAEGAEPQTGDGGGDINVDEGLLSTEVRLPLDLFSMNDESATPPSQEEIQASVDKEGYDIQVTVNDDETVSYRMSRIEFNRLKDEMKVSVDESIQEAINKESKIYKSVTYTDDMTEFDVVVNRKAQESSMSFFGLQLLVNAGFYQAITGIDESRRYVLVNYIDEKTGKVFDTYDSRNNENLN